MKLKATFSKLLTNKYVLNIVSILSLLSIIGYIMIGNIHAVIYFILVAFLVRCFSKNMIIVLGVPLIVSHIFILKNKSHIEGFDASGNTTDVSGNTTDISGNRQKVINKIKDKKASSTSSTSNVDESFETPNSETPNRKKGKYNIDYASTVENAYDELNKIIGSDGIKNLTADTQGLMKQQLQLAEAMNSMGPLLKGMGPLLNQAKGLLGTMGDGKEGSGGLGDIASMAKNFSAGLGGK